MFDCLRLFNDCSGYLLLACLFGGWVFLVDLYGCYLFWVVWLLVLGLGVILLWVVWLVFACVLGLLLCRWLLGVCDCLLPLVGCCCLCLWLVCCVDLLLLVSGVYDGLVFA